MRILPAANFALPLVVLILNCFLRGVPSLPLTTLDAVNASGSNSGMVIGIAAGCVSFGFMLLFLLFRWWWRTPHHKQPWGVDLQQKRRSVAQQRSPAQALGPQLSLSPSSSKDRNGHL